MANSAWLLLNQQLRDEVKEGLFASLAADNVADVCVCVSAIAIVEIALNMWPDFIQMMNTNGKQNESLFYKQAAITTLGLVMEDLDVAYLQDDEINQIWEMLLMNLGENQQQNIDLSMIKIVGRAISKLSKTTPLNFKNFSQ